jgi:hypothetical protein
MRPVVYHAVQRFEREVRARYPEVKLELTEPMGGADAAFRAKFSTLDWYDIWEQLHDIMMDIEEETEVWISILPEVPGPAAPA